MREAFQSILPIVTAYTGPLGDAAERKHERFERVVTITQPRKWNGLLYPPSARKERRAILKLVWPLMLMSAVMLLEIMLLQAWMRGEVPEKLPMIAMSPFLLFGLVWLGMEGLLRVDEWSNRRLKLAKRAVWLSPAKTGRIPWKRIVHWEFEPVVNRSHLTKLTVVSTWSAKHLRRWPLILSSPSDIQKLKRELEKRKQGVIIHPKPMPPIPRKKLNASGIWLFALGYYLLFHGAPLLGVSLNDPEARVHQEVTISQSARDFFSAHFATVEDYRAFLRYVGTVLTAAGVVSCLLAFIPGLLTHPDRDIQINDSVLTRKQIHM